MHQRKSLRSSPTLTARPLCNSVVNPDAAGARARVGPYEIGASLGSGGMGEGYRARGTRLNRDVAIKVQAESVAHDPDHLARFQREASLLAALNHPRLVSISPAWPTTCEFPRHRV